MASCNSSTFDEHHANSDDDADVLEQSLARACTEADVTAQRLADRAHEFRTSSHRLRRRAQWLANEADDWNRKEKESLHMAKVLGDQRVYILLRRNDVNQTSVDGRHLLPGYGPSLGEALTHNSVVTKLDLDLSCFRPTTTTCAAYSAAAAAAAADRSSLLDDALKELDPLLEFISTSTSLVDVGVYAGHRARQSVTRARVNRKLAHLLLESISRSKSIVSLTWNNLPVSSRPLIYLLHHCDSLQHLTIAFRNAGPYSALERQTIVSAIGRNATIKALNLSVIGDDELRNAILEGLPDMKSLQELQLQWDDDTDETFFDAVHQFLQSTSTLQTLKMNCAGGYLQWDGSRMSKVLSGLTHARGPTDTSVALSTTLVSSVSFCFEFHPIARAMEQLEAFLQTQTVNATGEIVYESRLRHVHISFPKPDYHWVGSPSLALAQSLLVQSSIPQAYSVGYEPRCLLIPTIGSQLCSISLTRVDPAFFYHLRDNADRVHNLQHLGLSIVSEATGMAFAQCISWLVSLRSVKVTRLERTSLIWIIRGLKTNGSIHKVITTVEDGDNGPSDFSVSQLRLIEAYCQRNRCLGELIVRKPSGFDTDDSNDSDGHSNSSNCNDDSTANAELYCRPMLLQVAMQVTSTGAVTSTRGLTALGPTIGQAAAPTSVRTSVSSIIGSFFANCTFSAGYF